MQVFLLTADTLLCFGIARHNSINNTSIQKAHKHIKQSKILKSIHNVVFKNVTAGKRRMGEAWVRDHLVHRLQIQIPNGLKEIG